MVALSKHLCVICGRAFKITRGFRLHVGRSHFGVESNIVCLVCGCFKVETLEAVFVCPDIKCMSNNVRG